VIKNVHLSVIVDGLEMQSDSQHSYLDIETGQIELVTDDDLKAAEEETFDKQTPDEDSGEEDMAIAEAEWDGVDVARAILNDPKEKRFLPLPESFDIDEYSIMRDFCGSLENAAISEQLSLAIRGSGAFRRFKDVIREHGIEESWYRYRADALKEIAIDWCESRHLAYEDDISE